MKAKDLNTLELFLEKYPVPVGQQQTGTSAKANKSTPEPKSPMAKGKSPSQAPSQSPTTQPNAVQEPEQPAEPIKKPVQDLEAGDQFKDADGNDAEYVDTVGNPGNPDAVVIKQKDGEMAVVDPDEEVEVPENLDDFKKLTRKKKRLHKRVKRLLASFEKFDSLSLEEQLDVISKIPKQKLDEAWSKKYKDSINCSNPKGFSQKAHCAGKKKQVKEEWRDVYRDYKGMGYSDAEARAEANRRYPDEAPQRPARVQQRPELAYYMFYDVPKDREQEALDMGVKKLKSGKFAIPVYNTSGRSTQIRITNANTAFGAGKQWAPKKTNETIEAEQDMAALLTAYGTPKKKKKKRKAKVKEGAVPVHNTKKDYQDIMCKPLLGSDIQGQMQAYFVVPDPSMIRDFRQQIAMAGKGTDLRSIFDHYAKQKLHPADQRSLTEARLNSDRTDKYLPIVQKIIDDGDATFQLGMKGDEGIFVADKGQTVNNRLDKLKGTIDGEPGEIKVNQIFKTPQMVAMVSGKDPNDISASASKEGFEIKPSQIFTDETFNASRVFAEVIENPVLQQSEIGGFIIEMAKQIENGFAPNFVGVPKEFHAAIRDYAGEYLGVLALIKGTADFPTRDAWLKHLGVDSISEILINFPKESNFALGDSIGSFENSKTGNMILISSKGGKKGAPPSLNGLKIPDDMKEKPAYQNEVDIIETLQGASGITQPFVGLNKLHEYNPKAVNPIVQKLLPFTQEDIEQVSELMNKKIYNKGDLNKLPEKFQPLVDLLKIDRVNDRATPGGIVHYALTKVLVDAVNNNNAMPNFEPLAREILQKNFIQIFARPKGDVLNFDVLWPSKDLATGKIELYSKASSTEPGKAKLSFSVT